MKMNPMSNAPKDRPILVKTESGWFQAQFDHKYDKTWNPIWSPFHGCGCCGDDAEEPLGWVELPDNP